MLKVTTITCEGAENFLGLDEAVPRFSWILEADGENILQKAYLLQVSPSDNFSHPVMDTGWRQSDQSVLIGYAGSPLQPSTRYFFRVSVEDNRGEQSGWSPVGWFETALLSSGQWNAPFISAIGETKPMKSPAWLIEKELMIRKEIASARAYATALGLYELKINGKPAGENVLAPGWTNYDKRLLYQTYDITSLLSRGSNSLSAIVGSGWYKGRLGFGFGRKSRNYFGKRTAFSMYILIRYRDGGSDWLTTGDDWTSRQSPVTHSEIFDGETYDARLEMPGAVPLQGVKVLKAPECGVFAQDGPLVVRREVLPLREILRTPNGSIVLDFGQILTGWVRFSVRGEPGEKVILNHGEVLDQQGDFYSKNLGDARQQITYILKGDGEERYEPRFTFQGFRYVELKSWPGEVRAEDFRAVVVHSDMAETGSFRSSHKLLNKLHHNILWSMKGNFLDIPTDCPQRNERMGWTGDAQAFMGTAAYLMDTSGFFRKWLRDLKSEQGEDGSVPHVVPDILIRGRGKRFDVRYPFRSAAGWSDAAVICPWEAYRAYGDRRFLEEHYQSMKAWVEYIRRHARRGLIWSKGFHYGDWLALDNPNPRSNIGSTPTDFVATAFYANSVRILADSAEILGRIDDAGTYNELHSRIKEAFQHRFLGPDGLLKCKTQSAQVFTLAFDLVPDELKPGITDDLVTLIEKAGNHLTTGFLGTVYLTQVLADQGRQDVAYRLLLRTEYPSWLYPVTRGATTIWERWNSINPDGSFPDHPMNSFNHYAYGAVGRFLHESVAGIREEEPGYRRITIKPIPDEALTWVESELMSPYGRIFLRWERKESEFLLHMEIPPNTQARVFLPGRNDSTIESEGIPVGSGTHEWIYKYDPS